MGDKHKKKFYLIDKKFKRNKKKYIVQCLMAAAAISAILIALNSLFNIAVLAAFGATCFIVFAMPHQKTSNPRRLIGGYIVGIAVGVGIYSLEVMLPIYGVAWLTGVCGALAVAISIFFMTMTNTEHPPAAGVALGIALEGFEPWGLVLIMASVLILVAVKYILRRWMIDLFE